MKVHKLEIPGLILITPEIYRDERGFFLETFRADSYKEILGVEFVQDNMSFSKYGTIRGLHFQREPLGQAKLIRCAQGRILDVAVDIRPDSPSYGQYRGVEMSGENQWQFFIPRGFAHGFSVLSPEALVEYKCSAYFDPDSDAGIRYDDPQLDIDWGISPGDMIISAKDNRLPLFSELQKGKAQ